LNLTATAARRWLVAVVLLAGCGGADSGDALEQGYAALRAGRGVEVLRFADRAVDVALADGNPDQLCEARALRVLALAAQPNGNAFSAEFAQFADACPDRIDSAFLARCACTLESVGRTEEAMTFLADAFARWPDAAERLEDLQAELSRERQLQEFISLMKGGVCWGY
jgi:hypothetical protein